MNRLRRLILILLLAMGMGLTTGSVYGSITFNFSYTFSSGLKLTGSLDGDQNGNLVENLSNISVLLDGTAMTIYPGPFPGIHPFGAIYSGGWNAIDGFTPGQPAVVSFDGTQNNFLFIDSDFPGDFSGSFFYMITDSGFYEASASMGAIPSGTDFGVAGSAVSEDGGRWSLRPAAVPEPATYIAGALLLVPFGVQGVRHLRYRKQTA